MLVLGNLMRDFPLLKEHLQAEILNKFPNTTDEDKICFEFLNIIEQEIINTHEKGNE